MPRKIKKDSEPSIVAENALPIQISSNPIDEVAQLPPAAPQAVKKKQQKKNFVVVASVGPNGIQGNLMPETRKPLIAHLQVLSKDVAAMETNIHYDPNPPSVIQAFEPNEIDSFTENPAKFSEENEERDAYKTAQSIQIQKLYISQQMGKANPSSAQKAAAAQDFYKKDQTLLVQFKNLDETKTIPDKTDVACFWCCHTFDNKPCVIPSRDLGTFLQVYGNFCCPGCAMAYLFDQRMDAHSRWEQLSLLNRVYGEMAGGRVFIAPARASLKIFGGPYSIEQYRDLIRSHKLRVDIHLPPMVSILSTMDTKPIDFYDASITKTILETAQERVSRAEEVLRLKRTKPLKAWESTLDACMNIRVGVVGERDRTAV